MFNKAIIIASALFIALVSINAKAAGMKSITSVGVLERDVSGAESPFAFHVKLQGGNLKGTFIVNEAPGGFDAASDIDCVRLLRTEYDGTLVIAVSGRSSKNASFGATITDDSTYDRGFDLSFNQLYGVLTLVPQSDGLYRAKRANWPAEAEACAFCDPTNMGNGDGTPNCNELPYGFPQHHSLDPLADFEACVAEDWQAYEFLDCNDIDDSSAFFGDTTNSARSQTSGKTIVNLN